MQSVSENNNEYILIIRSDVVEGMSMRNSLSKKVCDVDLASTKNIIKIQK